MTKATVTTTKGQALPKVDTIKHMVTKQDEKPMTGIRMQMEGNELVVRLDTTKFKNVEEMPLSASGKSYNFASTHGGRNLVIPGLDGLVLNLNLYASKDSYDEKLMMKRNKSEMKEAYTESLAKNEALQALAGLDPDTIHAILNLANQLGIKK